MMTLISQVNEEVSFLAVCRLVGMDRGRLVELGNHDELMAAEGHYYKLYQAQARNVDTEPAEPVAPVVHRELCA